MKPEAKASLLAIGLFIPALFGMLYLGGKIQQRKVAEFYNSLPPQVREAYQNVDRNRNGILEQSELEELSRLYDIKAKDYGLR